MKKHLIITLICVLALMLIATGCSKKTDTYEPSSVESSAADEGTLSMANIFADGMVLQRQEPINVYGFATEGESVTVTLGESTATAVSENGDISHLVQACTYPAAAQNSALALWYIVYASYFKSFFSTKNNILAIPKTILPRHYFIIL